MAKGIHCDVFIVRQDGRDVTVAEMNKLIQHWIKVCNAASCVPHGEWKIEDEDPRLVPPGADGIPRWVVTTEKPEEP